MITPGCNVSIALLHHPVYDKNRQVVTTAVTNLDIHDIARSARTYGLHRYFVVTPAVEQQDLTERIRRHWLEGWGATYNPKRREALELLQVMPDLATVLTQVEAESGCRPAVVVTGARSRGTTTGYGSLAEMIRTEHRHFLLVFGTGWGLTEEIFEQADFALEPIKGPGEYNHLSVRSAAAIILDRLLGDR
jgi:hypothetical protein